MSNAVFMVGKSHLLMPMQPSATSGILWFTQSLQFADKQGSSLVCSFAAVFRKTSLYYFLLPLKVASSVRCSS